MHCIPSYASYKYHLHWFGVHNLKKASCEVSAFSLIDFLNKGRKSAKNALIMLIDLFLHNFLEKIIFDFQITIDRVHPVQISSRSDNCITTDIM